MAHIVMVILRTSADCLSMEPVCERCLEKVDPFLSEVCPGCEGELFWTLETINGADIHTTVEETDLEGPAPWTTKAVLTAIKNIITPH